MDYKVAELNGFTSVQVEGDPSLDEFLRLVEVLGEQSRGWASDCALCDLRGVSTLKTYAEHYAVGQAVGRHLAHLRRVASVVPPDRITHTSEKTARGVGVNLRVFTSEGTAIEWLCGSE